MTANFATSSKVAGLHRLASCPGATAGEKDAARLALNRMKARGIDISEPTPRTRFQAMADDLINEGRRQWQAQQSVKADLIREFMQAMYSHPSTGKTDPQSRHEYQKWHRAEMDRLDSLGVSQVDFMLFVASQSAERKAASKERAKANRKASPRPSSSKTTTTTPRSAKKTEWKQPNLF